MACPRLLKSSVLVQIYSLPFPPAPQKRDSSTSISVEFEGGQTKDGLLAQLAERGADNAKVVSSSLTWTKVGERGVFFFNHYYLHSRSCLLWPSFDSGDVTLASAANCRPLVDRTARLALK